MSTYCGKAHVTLDLPCTCCTCDSTGDEPGAGGPTQPVPTPYLVLPYLPVDAGGRPIPAAKALYSRAIGWTIANPTSPGGWADYEIHLSCVVANRGDVASPAAVIEFYTGTAIDIRQPGHATLTPSQVKADVHPLGRSSFTAPPGTATTVTCPTPWVPGSADAAQQGILVQVRDMFTDQLTAPFDAVNDRHVARNDDLWPRVWNTGVNANADTLAPGASDSHWQLLSGPGVANSRPPFVLTEQHPGGAYYPTTDSMWIWQDAAGGGDLGAPYTFRLAIDLTGLDPSSATLSGSWGVDNDGTITFNDQQPPTGVGTFSLTDAAHDNYNLEHPFSITNGFLPGINNLDVQVTNVDGPASMNVTRLKLDATPL